MTTTTELKQAVGYRRVSTLEQSDERHVSLETQSARINAYCRASNLLSVGFYTDVASGRRDDRRQYQEMVDFAGGGGAEVIVVQYLDRFGRNPKEILRRVWDLQDKGVEVVATDEDIKEEMILLIRAGMAGAESKRTSERVRATMAQAVRKGVHVGRRPYGYRAIRKLTPAGKARVTRWEQDGDEAPVVRRMYEMAVERNLGYKGIADALYADGVPGREGKKWSSSTIQIILTNPVLKGDLVYGRRPAKGNPKQELVEVSGFFPAILNEDEWNALQTRLAIRREHARGHTHASIYLLSGIARCGHCGGPMVGKVGGKYKGRRYRNYWCSRAQNSKALCEYYNGHSVPKLERAILEYLGQYSDPAKVKDLLKEAGGRQLGRKESELQQVERRLETVEIDFHKNLDLLKRGILDERDFMEANAQRRRERADLETRRATLAAEVERSRRQAEMAKELPSRIGTFLEDFQGLDVRRQKAHLQTILRAAHVYRDGRLELEFRVE
ncbi:MAG: recombinase family protein [Chloroflexi bacterium]|nr:recombinase family protein [Chloroflexota bacterium]